MTRHQDKFADAEALARAGKLDAAHAAYASILQADPANTDARYRLAVVELMRGRFGEGADELRACLRDRPDNPDILFSLGRACIALADYGAAASHLAQGATLAPQRADIMSALGDACYLGGDTQEALHAYQAAHRLSPKDPRIPANMANALTRLGDHEQALKAARAAFDLAPDRAEIALTLANTLRTAGELDEALELTEELFRTLPDNPAVVASKAEILDRKGESEAAAALLLPWLDHEQVPAALARAAGQVAINRDQHVLPDTKVIDLIERCLGAATLNRLERRGLLFQQANLQQSLGETELAFETCHRANATADVTYDRNDADARFAAYRQTFSDMALKNLARASAPAERPLFIVGLPRSGTTLVEQILDSHPDVAGGGELEGIPTAARETGGYPASVSNLEPADLDRMAAAYMTGLDRVSAEARFVTDKMPINTEHLGLIWQMFPGARVIHVQRHPLATGLSCYFQNFRSGNAFTFSLEGFAHYYRHTDRLMKHWRETLDLPIHSIRYEDLVRDPRPTIEALLAACDLPWDDACMAFDRNTRFVATLSYAQVRKPLSNEPLERHARYATQLQPLADALADEITAYETSR